MPEPVRSSVQVDREVRDALFARKECSVFIYPAVAGPSVEFEPFSEREIGRKPRVVDIVPPDPARASQDDQLLARIEQDLTKALGAEPFFHTAVQAFVASVNRQTLDNVIAIPGLERIALNGTARAI